MCTVAMESVASRVGHQRTVVVHTKDRFGNATGISARQVVLRCIDCNPPARSQATSPFLEYFPSISGVAGAIIDFTLPRATIYRCQVSMQPTIEAEWFTLRQDEFLPSLSDSEWKMFHTHLVNPSPTSHKSKLLSEGSHQGSNIYIFVTPKQLIIKYYVMCLIPIKLCTIRVAPFTIIDITENYKGDKGRPVFSIGEKGSDRLVIACEKRNVVLALYWEFLAKRFENFFAVFEIILLQSWSH